VFTAATMKVARRSGLTRVESLLFARDSTRPMYGWARATAASVSTRCRYGALSTGIGAWIVIAKNSVNGCGNSVRNSSDAS
jgi:hypothetical protein